MSREALVLLVCCCDFRDGAERLIPSKSLRNAVIWAFPGLLCILRMCAPRRAAAVVRPRGREKSADRRRRILISRLLIIRASVPRRKSPFPAYFRGFPAVSPLIPPYPAFLKYPVSPHRKAIRAARRRLSLLRQPKGAAGIQRLSDRSAAGGEAVARDPQRRTDTGDGDRGQSQKGVVAVLLRPCLESHHLLARGRAAVRLSRLRRKNESREDIKISACRKADFI